MVTTLTKGQSYTDPSGNTGTVGFDSATGKPLAEGQTTTIPDTAPATPATPTITADNLAPMTPIKLPEQVPDTTSQEIINGATAAVETQKIIDQDKADKTASTEGISKILADIGVVEGKESGYATQAGADKAKEQSDRFQSLIDVESKALKNYKDELYRNPNLTTTLVGRLATEQERKSASYISDLEINKSIVDRDYDRAISQAEKKVEAELAPLKRDYDAKKFIFDANIDKWNESEKSILQSALQKQEREYEAEKDKKTQVENLKIEMMKNGAPASVVSKITSIEDVYSNDMAIKYMSDPLDRSYKQAQINKLLNSMDSDEQYDSVKNSLLFENQPTALLANFFDKNPKLKQDDSLKKAGAVISGVEEFAGKNADGKFRGIGFLAKGFLTGKGEERRTNKADIAALNLRVQDWASGASLTKEQERYVKRLVPDKNDSDRKAQSKVNALTNYMLSDIKGRVAVQGADFEYVPVSFFDKKATVGDIGVAINQAVASGYQSTDIITEIEKNYPEYSESISEARSQGYTDEEILSFISSQN